MNKQIYITINIFFLISTFSFGQTILKTNKINLVGIENVTTSNYLTFYSFKEKNLYEICLTEDKDSINVKLDLDIECDGRITTQKDLSKNNILLKRRDILTFDFEKYFKNKKFEVIKGDEKFVFSILNNQIIIVEEFKYEEFYDPIQDKRITDWNYSSSDFYGYYYLEIEKGKKILLLSKKNGFIIPTENKILISIDSKEFTDSKPTNIDSKDLKLGLRYFRADDFYYIQKEGNNKFSFRDRYNTKVLSKVYDTLFFNSKFIVGRKNKQFEIYNTRLDNFNLKNIRAVFEKRSFLQVLQKNEVKIINFLNNNEKYKEDPISVCGTVTGYVLEIENNIVTYKIDRSFSSPNEKVKVIKGDLSKLNLDSFKFLNNTNKLDFDDNTFYLNPNFEYMHKWLIVSKNNKFGLIQIIESENEITFKEILPIIYDVIESTGYVYPLKLKKDNLYTYYNVNKKRYKTLDKYNYYFCRFENEYGQVGWLDYKGNEYFD